MFATLAARVLLVRSVLGNPHLKKHPESGILIRSVLSMYVKKPIRNDSETQAQRRAKCVELVTRSAQSLACMQLMLSMFKTSWTKLWLADDGSTAGAPAASAQAMAYLTKPEAVRDILTNQGCPDVDRNAAY